MAKHTLGPWKTSPDTHLTQIHGNSYFDIETQDECIPYEDRSGHFCAHIALVDGPHNSAEAKANAYLIAAAPEMLEALEAIFNTRAPQFNFDFSNAPDMQLVASAIQKAKGDV